MDSVKVVVVASPFANMSPIYEVDADADVLLIVPPNTKPFAPWDELSLPNGVSPQKTSAALNSTSGLRIKASSKHLSLASRVFRNKLQYAASGSKNSTQSDGRVHLSLAARFSPKAVSIVLNAIHSRGSKVPREVDLDTLAQIALFVDKLQLFDAVEVYADRWIAKLEDSISEAYDRDLVLWLYVSHVFRRAEVFKAVTKVAVAHSTGPLRDLGLPIREKIIRDIESQRQSLLSKSLTILHNTLTTLISGNPASSTKTTTTKTCQRYHCDSFLLGELIKTLHQNRIPPPFSAPTKPYQGVSHAAIVDALNTTSHFQWRSYSSLSSSSPDKDLWGVPVPGVVSKESGSISKKRKSPNGHSLNLNGNNHNNVSASKPPITPDSSPEPVSRSVSLLGGKGDGGGGDGLNGTSFENHVCEARRLVGRLDELDALEEGIVGLELAGGLGFQRY